ncbi:DUF2795 domain-containing protein [Sphaerisporangium rubeum]|uniref:DUF2795 domain-containing protein n=1 Tax=Sphaerisporangium rubeum TaxID=321317 RepID=A0A7X0M766_9ACTN|nr:DUF2795 domain-containing protein [Sphaerisporangium rubeum]MBB6472699.1 hypothetical protein [Sphaerisporangium rubeum]
MSGVDYPVTKEQLLEHAKSHKADEKAMEALRQLPEGTFDGPNAVSKAVART